MAFKLIIAGGRDFADYYLMQKSLYEYIKANNLTKDIEIVSGNAKGADKLGERLAREFKIPCKSFPAEWDNLEAKPCVIRYNREGKPYNALAGNNRNKLMADYADGLLAFWDGVSSGTADMIELARQKGINTTIIGYGEVT